MSVAEMERRFYELKGKFDVGALGEDEFKAEIEKLRFQDAQSRWWMIGAQSGRWYMYDGTRWVPGQPPAESPASPPPSSEPASQPAAPSQPATEPAASVPPAQPAPAHSEFSRLLDVSHTHSAATDSNAAQPAPATPLPAAAPAAPKREPVVVARRRPRPAAPAPEATHAPLALPIPVRGPVLIGCAALLAIFLVILFWAAIENLIPGHPISSGLAALSGAGKPSANVTPTRSSAPTAVGDAITQYIMAGDQFVLQSQFDPAIAQYQAAAQVSQTSPVPLTHWSRALAFRGQMMDALNKVRSATQRSATDAEAQAQLARMLAWTGDVTQAQSVGEKAVQLDPQSSNAHAFLAEIYLLSRRSADAATQAQLALKIAPQSAEAHRAQAWVLTIAGQKDGAMAEWRQTLALEPNLAMRHFEVGDVSRVYFNDPANAAAEYRRAAALDGAYIPVYNRLGLALLAADQPQQAVPQFSHAMTLDPANPEVYAYIAVAYGRADQCGQAIPYFEQALRMDPGSSVASKGLADCKSGKAPALPVFTPAAAPLVPPPVAVVGATSGPSPAAPTPKP